MVAFYCPQCQGEFQVSASLFGQDAVCPLCRNLIAVTSEETAAVPNSSEPPSETTPRQKVASAAQKVSCPKCSTEFPVHPAQRDQVVACPGCFQRIDLGQETASSANDPAANIPKPDEQPSLNAEPSSVNESSVDNELRPASDEAVPENAAEAIAEPTAEPKAYSVKDGPRTVQVGDKVVELNTLTREERTKLRFRKNLFMLFASVVVLIGALLYLSGIVGNHSRPQDPAQDSVDPMGQSEQP